VRYFIQPQNYVRNWRTGLGALSPLARPSGTPLRISSASLAPVYSPGRACPAWGCGNPRFKFEPFPVGLPGATPGTGTTSTPPASTGATAGSPVPAGFNQNSVFIASDGSQWEYSTSAGKWIDVGTPYNLNSPGVTPPAVTPGTASSASQVSGTPVPIGYPIGQAFTDATGNTWQYSAAYGVWTMTVSAAGSSAALTAGAGSVPVGTATNAPYTDASGNTWVYNPTTGAWTLSSAAGASPYDSILTFLSSSSLGSAVGIQIPNWITLSALGFVALKLSHGQPAGRR
jgi:hypothetical protein